MRKPQSKTLARGKDALGRAKLLECACLFHVFSGAFGSMRVGGAITTGSEAPCNYSLTESQAVGALQAVGEVGRGSDIDEVVAAAV